MTNKVARGFVATSFPGSLIFLPSPLLFWVGGKMRDPGNEVGFAGELNENVLWQVVIISEYFLTFFQNLVNMMEELLIAIGIHLVLRNILREIN